MTVVTKVQRRAVNQRANAAAREFDRLAQQAGYDLPIEVLAALVAIIERESVWAWQRQEA